VDAANNLLGQIQPKGRLAHKRIGQELTNVADSDRDVVFDALFGCTDGIRMPFSIRLKPKMESAYGRYCFVCVYAFVDGICRSSDLRRMWVYDSADEDIGGDAETS
jgi:hypothetical protein